MPTRALISVLLALGFLAAGCGQPAPAVAPAAAKAHERWPIGKLLTEAEYDAGMKAATTFPLR